MRFKGLVEATLGCAETRGWQVLPVDAAFSQNRRLLPSGELVLNTWRMGLERRGELRMAQIESAKVHVFTCFLYPDPILALPLYAMELVEIGSKPIVAVLDMVTPSADPAKSWSKNWLEAAHERTADIVNADDVPDWYIHCRSGSDFFVRPSCAAETDRVGSHHLEAVKAILESPTTVTRNEPQRQAWLNFEARYKSHHSTNSPGLPLLQRSYGIDWTNRYMADCFFA